MMIDELPTINLDFPLLVNIIFQPQNNDSFYKLEPDETVE